jgi:hypothetical protein
MKTTIFSALSFAAALIALAPGKSFAQNNTKMGTDALRYNTTGHDNSAFGDQTLKNSETGTYLTGFGHQSLVGSYHSHQNTGIGAHSVSGGNVVTGFGNTGCGSLSLDGLTAGHYNTAIGFKALRVNGGGTSNTAIGSTCLESNTLGSDNTAVGATCMTNNMTGNSNTAVGMGTLRNNVAGSYNTAIGGGPTFTTAVPSNGNTSHGQFSMQNATGNQCVAFGDNAMINARGGAVWNVAVGSEALRVCNGRDNIAIGKLAGNNLLGDVYNIHIGTRGSVGDNHTVRIGQSALQKHAYLAGVHGATSAGGVRVFVNANGRLGTLTSSRKFKTDIADMSSASDVLRNLRPVSFHYNTEIDREQVPQFGLIAEEVADVASDLVARDANGDIYTVRYDAVNAMLLNEFQKQHQLVRTQDAQRSDIKVQLDEQKKTIALQQEKLQELSRRASDLMAQMNDATQKVD